MRIIQLAKKLDITPTSIIDFLNKQDKQGPINLNTKISDQLLETVLDHFAPMQKAEILSLAGHTTIKDKVEDTPSQPQGGKSTISYENNATHTQSLDELKESVQKPIELPQRVDNEEDNKKDNADGNKHITIKHIEAGPNKKDDVIRAKKINKGGIKILGKIDLPETKKPKVNKQKLLDTSVEDILKQASEKARIIEKIKNQENKPERKDTLPSKPNQAPQNNNYKPKSSSFTYEQRKLKEEQLLQKKLKDEKQRIKDLKRAHYFNKIEKPKKEDTTKKNTRPEHKQLQPSPSPIQNNKDLPLVQRIWNWLTKAD